jgi:UDP-glucose 4-epimerase
MSVLVTGGAVFIGSHLVERLLKEGFDVIVLDNLYSGKIENLDLKNRRLSFFGGMFVMRRSLEKF